MPPDDFQILNAAFDRSLSMGEEQRQEFLKRFRIQYPHLIDRLMGLLESDANDQDLLQTWVNRNIADFADKTSTPWIGEVIDKWRITDRLGEGGMGAVFRAERIDGHYTQEIAIKILTTQLVRPDAVRRFRSERQILAKLNHPHIASLLDGGTTSTNLPYLVMELVDGIPIHHHCKQANLDLKGCLRLFIHIIEAVEYAHRKLVVHRDLKPDNILVNNEGEPKLLDFGIAKLLEPTDGDMLAAQTIDQPALTPEYASPEQILGEKISAATDVYALGVILYRLITGTSPYGDAATTRHQVATAIVQYEPKKPSTVISAAASDNSEDRDGVDPYQVLHHSAHRDLDHIILKCLQKEPSRRYVSAQALADDLKNFLKHRPVQARGNSAAYRFKKFLRRKAPLVAVTGLAATTLVGLSVFYQLNTNELNQKVEIATSLNEQLIRPGFKPSDAVTSQEDVPLTGVFKFKESQQKNEFEMLNPYTVRVRNLRANGKHGRWFIYTRIGPRKFHAKMAVATYTLLDDQTLVWESTRKVELVRVNN